MSINDRQVAIDSITQAVNSGARQHKACEIINLTARTLQRWKATGLQDQRLTVQKASPPNKLSETERKEIIDICNNPEYASMSAKQIVPTLADKGVYIASESSFYRVLRDNIQSVHRGKSNKPRNVTRPEAYVTHKANQLWSWDITYLAGNIRGVFYYLYLFMDIYSRKVVGWEVHECQSADYASEVLGKAKLSEGLSYDHQLVLHSDNGTPMKGATMLATMQKLGVIPSFSRPSVSNDNPYSESLFKTLKYVPKFPEKPFGDVDQARGWVNTFVNWYNKQHHHSGLKYVTPEQRHTGIDVDILKNRKILYTQAKLNNPLRWSKNIRNWNHESEVFLNKINETKTVNKAA